MNNKNKMEKVNMKKYGMTIQKLMVNKFKNISNLGVV